MQSSAFAPQDARQLKLLFPCWIKRDKTARLPWITTPGVTRNDWIRVNREGPLRSTVYRFLCD
jgi:hypothetical protein